MSTDDYNGYVFDDDGEIYAHGLDCDCDECLLEHAQHECGELPEHLGGGCMKAGSEECDFDCPFRDRVLGGVEEE